MGLSEDLSAISDQLKMVTQNLDSIVEGEDVMESEDPMHEADPGDPAEDYAEGEDS